ncbi:hypothetical protein [Paractinoplanes hotanensis]|uniref:Uncharacterized protein n=1 Tax=Paractinoplanes hotanensis TaxID=2906497 RepID=A0ABT0Y5B8_9ACTN|nr:hypothetical protein [Actinoplanes hotanensis]MCM4081060.1 hypothetical protein [Actinoplanes hotanensis]
MTALKTPDAGIEAARTTLVELGKAVVRGRVDAGEPLLAPAFVQAAKNLVERRLIAPALSAVTPARHLSASVRTFQRAFVLSVLWRIC